MRTADRRPPVRRLGPRPVGASLREVLTRAAPPTLIARVQRRWRAAVGETIAAEATPLDERDGVVKVGCRSAVWAEELSLLAPKLLRRLNAALEDEGGGGQVRGLAFVTRGDGAER